MLHTTWFMKKKRKIAHKKPVLEQSHEICLEMHNHSLLFFETNKTIKFKQVTFLESLHRIHVKFP